jgi:hypothetical protein
MWYLIFINRVTGDKFPVNQIFECWYAACSYAKQYACGDDYLIYFKE